MFYVPNENSLIKISVEYLSQLLTAYVPVRTLSARIQLAHTTSTLKV